LERPRKSDKEKYSLQMTISALVRTRKETKRNIYGNENKCMGEDEKKRQ
jgi:hypothetical protein